MSTASKVAEHKAKHPELYCPHIKCLWRTGGTLCPRHLATAPYKIQERQIRMLYNAIAQAEARPDLEEQPCKPTLTTAVTPRPRW